MAAAINTPGAAQTGCASGSATTSFAWNLEGSKRGNELQFSNSDPGLIRLFADWAHRYLGGEAPKLGINFSGVSVDTLLESAGVLPGATHVLAFSHTAYTTNLPLADVTDDQVRFRWKD